MSELNNNSEYVAPRASIIKVEIKHILCESQIENPEEGSSL